MPITMNANQSISRAMNEESAIPAHQYGGQALARRPWGPAVPAHRGPTPGGTERAASVLQRMPGVPPLRLLALGEGQGAQNSIQRMWTAAPDEVLEEVADAIISGNWPPLHHLQGWMRSLNTTRVNLSQVRGRRQDENAIAMVNQLRQLVHVQIEGYRHQARALARVFYG
jgi:hypothetical protein